MYYNINSKSFLTLVVANLC